MTTAEILSAILNTIIAFGTIAVAILAIWGDPIRARFSGPKLRIELQDPHGYVTGKDSGQRSIYYHMRVVNQRQSVSATNCRVILKRMWRRDLARRFKETTLPVPLPYQWAPSEITPPYINLRDDHVFDFGIIRENESRFSPLLLSHTDGFAGFLVANECIRYGLQIVSDNFASNALQVFEVEWNGQWSENLEVMSQNLQIREVTDATSQSSF